MDERLPLGSMDAATLRMLLDQERERRQGLEQEVARLQAGLARQNDVLMELQRPSPLLPTFWAELSNDTGDRPVEYVTDAVQDAV